MSEAASITVRVPLTIRRRPGRRTVVTPVRDIGEEALPTRADPALVKALARAFRYQRLLDEGRYASISEAAAAIEAAVVGQVRALLRQPEVVVGTWLAARAEAPDLTEAETRDALERLDPLWDELFPAEQARIVRLLVERVEVEPEGVDVRLRVAGLAGLVRDLGAGTPDASRAAA